MSGGFDRRALVLSGGAALVGGMLLSGCNRPEPPPPPPMPQPRALKISNIKYLALVVGARKLEPIETAIIRKGLADPISVSFWTTWDWRVCWRLDGNGFVLAECELKLPDRHLAKLDVTVRKELNDARKVVGAPPLTDRLVVTQIVAGIDKFWNEVEAKAATIEQDRVDGLVDRKMPNWSTHIGPRGLSEVMFALIPG